MHIKELTQRTGIPERQVRFLISEGFMPPPRGGRANADYGEDHLVAIERYSRLREIGFPPAAIKLLLQAKEGVSVPVAPGISLVIDPNLIASGTPVEPLIEIIKHRLSEHLKEPTHEHADATNDN